MDAGWMLALSMQYGVWTVFVGILLDNAGLPLPGELFLLIFGALARHGDVRLDVLLLMAVAAAVAGDSIAYWVGRWWGDRFLHFYCRATRGSTDCARRAVQYYARHGAKTVIFGRFLVGIRVFLCPLAGSVGLRFPQFFLLDCAGALIWSGLFTLVGYAVNGQIESLQAGYRTGVTVLASGLAVGLAVYVLTKLSCRGRSVES